MDYTFIVMTERLWDAMSDNVTVGVEPEKSIGDGTVKVLLNRMDFKVKGISKVFLQFPNTF